MTAEIDSAPVNLDALIFKKRQLARRQVRGSRASRQHHSVPGDGVTACREHLSDDASRGDPEVVRDVAVGHDPTLGD